MHAHQSIDDARIQITRPLVKHDPSINSSFGSSRELGAQSASIVSNTPANELTNKQQQQQQQQPFDSGGFADVPGEEARRKRHNEIGARGKSSLASSRLGGRGGARQVFAPAK